VKSAENFFGYIAFGMGRKWYLGSGDFIIGVFGIEHIEAVVVLGGENHIFHSGFLCGSGPFFRIEPDRIEGEPSSSYCLRYPS
jgi:hypothetical protein